MKRFIKTSKGLKADGQTKEGITMADLFTKDIDTEKEMETMEMDTMNIMENEGIETEWNIDVKQVGNNISEGLNNIILDNKIISLKTSEQFFSGAYHTYLDIDLYDVGFIDRQSDASGKEQKDYINRLENIEAYIKKHVGEDFFISLVGHFFDVTLDNVELELCRIFPVRDTINIIILVKKR